MFKTLKIIATFSIIVSLAIVITSFLSPAMATSYFFKIITLLAFIALISHFIEAIIAFVYTYNKTDNPLKLAIYTFFTGTLGLKEIWHDYGQKSKQLRDYGKQGG
jgi:RsiW-degrading membrane proteinase PrsW (M82 family)